MLPGQLEVPVLGSMALGMENYNFWPRCAGCMGCVSSGEAFAHFNAARCFFFQHDATVNPIIVCLK
jgi:hypothetical protein